MLRIFVFSLLLANILLIALRLLQPDAGSTAVPAGVDFASKKLPSIELAENPPAGERLENASALDRAETGLAEGEVTEQESAPTGFEVDSAPVDRQSMACIQFGPFENEASMAELKVELTELFDHVQTREKSSIVDNGYWVYLPKYPTRTEAEQAINDLSAAGAREFYIVPTGSMANAISLGVYQRRDRAEYRRQQLADLGLPLDFMIGPQTEIETRYWMEAGPVNPLNPTLMGLSHNNPNIQQIQVDCLDGGSREEPGVESKDPATATADSDKAAAQN